MRGDRLGQFDTEDINQMLAKSRGLAQFDPENKPRVFDTLLEEIVPTICLELAHIEHPEKNGKRTSREVKRIVLRY